MVISKQNNIQIYVITMEEAWELVESDIMTVRDYFTLKDHGRVYKDNIQIYRDYRYV